MLAAGDIFCQAGQNDFMTSNTNQNKKKQQRANLVRRLLSSSRILEDLGQVFTIAQTCVY